MGSFLAIKVNVVVPFSPAMDLAPYWSDNHIIEGHLFTNTVVEEDQQTSCLDRASRSGAAAVTALFHSRRN